MFLTATKGDPKISSHLKTPLLTLIRLPVFQLFAVIGILASVLPQDARADGDEALIDKSIEPPLVLSPDFTERPQPVMQFPAVVTNAFGPVGPAARQPTGALSGRIVSRTEGTDGRTIRTGACSGGRSSR